MKIASVRQSVSASLKAIGHKPKIQGGNGKPVSIPTQRLAAALGWSTKEIVVCTGLSGQGYPSSYKIDLGQAVVKLGIEIDGHSHSALIRRAQDRKKEEFLKSQGWTILRFPNEQVIDNLDECVRIVNDAVVQLEKSVR